MDCQTKMIGTDLSGLKGEMAEKLKGEKGLTFYYDYSNQ